MPETLTLNVSYGAFQQVTLSGQLSGGIVANQEINLSGVVNGSTTTNSTGGYSITLKAMSLGEVYASAPTINTAAETVLVDNGPVISNLYSKESGRLVTVGGWVTDNWNPQGWTVNLTAAGYDGANGSTTVYSDGEFAFSFDVPYGPHSFTVAAQATDPWGEKSNEALIGVETT